MWQLQQQETEFAELLGQASVDDAPRAEHRTRLRVHALQAFEQQRGRSETRFWTEILQAGGDLMRRRPTRYVLAAAFVLVVLSAWMQLHEPRSASAAFYEFASALVNARSARFKMEVNIPGQPNVKAEGLFLAPARMRQTLPGLISISDMKAGKIVNLRPDQKKAMVINLVGRGALQGPADIFERLRTMLENKAKTDESLQPIGERIINGQRALGFREATPMATITIWGDPKTGLPLQIETVMSGLPRSEVNWTDFELNVDLDEGLFDITPPDGYEVQEFELDASPYTEQDLVETFRLASEIRGGTFPDTLDTLASQQLVIQSVRSKKGARDDEVLKRLMDVGAKIARGFGFALQLPRSADAHYAGKDVRRDTPGTPIFWYRPEGSRKYRVIDADLTVREADAPPEVPGAMAVFDSVPATSPKISSPEEK